MQRDGIQRAFGKSLDVGLRRVDDRLQIIQTFFIRNATGPVNLITTEFMFTLQVVNIGARECLAVRVEKKKQAQLARFMSRIKRHRRSFRRNVNTAGAVDDFEIDSDSGSDFKLVTHPEAAVRRTRLTCDNRGVDLRLEIRTFDRREVSRLA